MLSNNGKPRIIVENFFTTIINGWELVIAETKEMNINYSDHGLKEKLLDWYAHFCLNKKCMLLEICNDFGNYFNLDKKSCQVCDFVNAFPGNNHEYKRTKYWEIQYPFRERYYGKQERYEACRNGEIKKGKPDKPLVLVHLDLYEPRGFPVGNSSGPPKSRDDDLFDLSMDIIESDISKRESFFEVRIGNRKHRLDTTDFDKAMDQAQFLGAGVFEKVFLLHHNNGNKEIYPI